MQLSTTVIYDFYSAEGRSSSVLMQYAWTMELSLFINPQRQQQAMKVFSWRQRHRASALSALGSSELVRAQNKSQERNVDIHA